MNFFRTNEFRTPILFQRFTNAKKNNFHIVNITNYLLNNIRMSEYIEIYLNLIIRFY